MPVCVSRGECDADGVGHRLSKGMVGIDVVVQYVAVADMVMDVPY